ncbi:hypothetical protein OOK39_43680 [Streptomyces sp. NBC_00264]|uniref:hypothetical protein n=1 Tax=unclassified Streptomyces TaxID=2593676 RepID=UPI0022559409|nr:MULTISPECIES: hypothetical protein [unclassified Streptomyces]MCX4399320.1 hypothetical protein [Streptomyces sp. NBC_01767]MCX5166064.1 hypothetical protein [Streptomyces sp. NBC_00305]MCX5224491.1 hypothetical protein [Streptomyces sp. NBC_00264]WSC25536.1 hypothetical protein OG902_01885 [Streptomyces sp. NBC_01768]
MFDLIHSPADADRTAPDTPGTVYACTTGDPRITDVPLREIHPGDLLHVTGTVVQPDVSVTPAQLHCRRPGDAGGRVRSRASWPADE